MEKTYNIRWRMISAIDVQRANCDMHGQVVCLSRVKEDKMTSIRADECPHCGHREWKDVTEEHRKRNHELWKSGLIPDKYHSHIQDEFQYECLNCGRVANVSSPMEPLQ